MKEALIIPFVLFSLAAWSSWSNAEQATMPQGHELSRDRHAQQDGLKQGHSHDVKPKSKYDLRNIDGKRGGDGHKHVHDHGNTHHHDHGDARMHKHAGTDLHEQDNHHGGHDGHDHGHGDHAHGYDRVWSIGISG